MRSLHRLLLVHLGRDGRLEAGAVPQRGLAVDLLLAVLGHNLFDDLTVAFHQPPTTWVRKKGPWNKIVQTNSGVRSTTISYFLMAAVLPSE